MTQIILKTYIGSEFSGTLTPDFKYWNGSEFTTTPCKVKGDTQKNIENAKSYILQSNEIGDWWTEKLESITK